MKLVLKKPEDFFKRRLNIYKKEVPCLDNSWHYHAEFELLYISKSTGIRFVGDSVAPFSPGDLVLVGAYLPHLWRNDITYYNDQTDSQVKTIVIKFTKNFIGEDTFDNPEFSCINHLLNQSKYGICFGKNFSKDLHKSLMEIPNYSAVQQSIKLLDILNQLSLSKDKQILSSTDMRQYAQDNAHRLDNVLKHISDNYAEPISLEDVANIACMTTNSFCRFFKKMTNKSFTKFLNEVRIRNASRVLAQENTSIADVSYTVGYNSVNNFNKQFKLIIGTTPKQYRKTITSYS